MSAEGYQVTKTEAGDVVRYALASSTMDKAKELCKSRSNEWLVVYADQQVSGRGTNGRTWVSPLGNAYMSICVPKNDAVLPMQRLMYLPLETGIAVITSISRFMPAGTKMLPEKADSQLSLKWPNDVLLNGKKVSGNLIEDGGSHMIVGIGVNVSIAPELTDGGRPADCLTSNGATCTAPDMVLAIFNTLKSNLLTPPHPDTVALYGSHMDWTRPVNERNSDGTRGQEGIPVRLTKEGHLVVKHGPTEKILINEYLF